MQVAKLCPQRTFKFKENVLADSMSVLIINVVNEASFPVYIDKYRSHLCFDCSVFTTNLDSIGNLLKHTVILGSCSGTGHHYVISHL